MAQLGQRYLQILHATIDYHFFASHELKYHCHTYSQKYDLEEIDLYGLTILSESMNL